jgi:hypothetical protein
MAKLYFAFFSKQTSPKMVGLESTKPHQKMFLEFSKLGLDCSLNISPARHDTLLLHFGFNLFQVENGF